MVGDDPFPAILRVDRHAIAVVDAAAPQRAGEGVRQRVELGEAQRPARRHQGGLVAMYTAAASDRILCNIVAACDTLSSERRERDYKPGPNSPGSLPAAAVSTLTMSAIVSRSERIRHVTDARDRGGGLDDVDEAAVVRGERAGDVRAAASRSPRRRPPSRRPRRPVRRRRPAARSTSPRGPTRSSSPTTSSPPSRGKRT